MGASRLVPESELLRAVLRGSPVSVATIDRELRFLLTASEPLPIGVERGAEHGSSFAELYGDLPGVLQAVRIAFAGEEARVTYERGGAVHLLSLLPHQGAAGEVDTVIVVSTALSQRGLVEQALAETQARERRIFQSSMVGLLYWDETGAITDANDAFLALLGHTRAELMLNGMSWIELTPPEHRPADEIALQELRTAGVCTPFEKEYLHKDGHRVPVLIGGSSWGIGRLGGVAFVVDLSERRRQEREFHEAESRLRRVVDLAPIVLWAVDAAGVFTLSTGRGLQALGLKPNQVVGLSVFDVYAEVPQVLAAVRRGLQGEEVAETLDVAGHIFDSRVTPLFGSSGGSEGVLGVSFDITERRRAEQQQAALEAQLLQVQKLESLGLLAGGIAHDFNNILTVILGGASSALMSLPAHSIARLELESVVTAAQRAAGLTHQMLAYAGKARVEVRRIDLSAHVREIAELLETTMSKKVELKLDLEAGLPLIEADVAQVQQVVMNLVINSADAIGEQTGTIFVATGVLHLDAPEVAALRLGQSSAPGLYVFLEVRDTGPGMDEATKGKIFDPFFTTKFTGRGLGLAAVHGIVRAHRAAVLVDSSPGHGTTFRVLFPGAAGSIPPSIAQFPVAFRGEGRVLVIDDDPAVRATTCRMLTSLGFSVLDAPDGRVGTELFVQHVQQIALVVVDLTMPVMNGEETFAALRRVREDIPILLMSGYDEFESTRWLARQERSSFLRKPFSSADLVAKVQETLKQSVSSGSGNRG